MVQRGSRLADVNLTQTQIIICGGLGISKILRKSTQIIWIAKIADDTDMNHSLTNTET